ncbi:GntR family transcriptional regulator [Pseudomonas sp. McL0111]|uniref:GntR family transcriptional regulator n=1 Tax=Pseudomonas sp. McL0111 TaxID=3457357 RepID=UPI00403E5CFB
MNSFATPSHPCQTATALPLSRHLDPPSAEDDLYARMFDAILEQRLSPTSRFTPESLARMFDAPRTVTRQVLTRLAHQQVMILRPNLRPTVTTTNLEQARQILHARRLAESTVIELFCQQYRPDAIARLRESVRQQRLSANKGEHGRVIRLSGEFHLMLAEFAGNRPLAHFLGSLVPLTSLVIAQHAQRGDPQQAIRCHATITDALERSEQQLGVKLMLHHLHELELTLTPTTT